LLSGSVGANARIAAALFWDGRNRFGLSEAAAPAADPPVAVEAQITAAPAAAEISPAGAEVAAVKTAKWSARFPEAAFVEATAFIETAAFVKSAVLAETAFVKAAALVKPAMLAETALVKTSAFIKTTALIEEAAFIEKPAVLAAAQVKQQRKALIIQHIFSSPLNVKL
jgi:UDP-3-O-[3-hydroxymyristoyl] glucosamine N-acyltransferase